MKVAFLMQNRPDYTQRVPQGLDWFEMGADPQGNYNSADMEKVGAVDALVASIRDPVHEQLLQACTNLKIIQRMGVGYDNVDTEAAAQRGIPVCNLGDVNKDALGEHGMALMLALARRIVEIHPLTAQADWTGARALCDFTYELQGRTLGVLGFGKSGYELARRARVFGMHIIYYSRSPVETRLREAVQAEERSFEQLFRESDFLSINVSLNPSTQNLVGARELGWMKPTAYLINLARGGIVDEQALADALNADKLGGAGIDVFSPEPISKENPLLSARNTVLTAHIAGTTKECTDREVGWALENVERYLVHGQSPRWIVNGVKV
ncbi:MAG: NAD(P)-dependent oxidoreductase [SAR324 cluster bacterium]|nr:NAD(P)-dependent oxidoreductase [SAR324 cluster bacterium]